MLSILDIHCSSCVICNLRKPTCKAKTIHITLLDATNIGCRSSLFSFTVPSPSSPNSCQYHRMPCRFDHKQCFNSVLLSLVYLFYFFFSSLAYVATYSGFISLLEFLFSWSCDIFCLKLDL